MSKGNRVDVCLISRSDCWPDHIAMVDKAGKQWTYAEYFESGPYGYHRNDIGLVNLEFADGSHEQLVIEPTTKGEPNWSGAKRYLTRAEVKACREENRKTIEIAATSEVYRLAMRL